MHRQNDSASTDASASATGQLRVLLFGGVAEVMKSATLVIPLDGTLSARQVLERVCEVHPALAPYRSSVRLAVNSTYADWDEPVRANDEVAMIPPVAGG